MKADCRHYIRDAAAGKIQPDRAGRYKGKAPKEEAKGKGGTVGAVEGVGAIVERADEEEETGFIFMLAQPEAEEARSSSSSSTAVLVDTAAARSVSPLWFAPAAELRPTEGSRLEQPDGTPLKHHGERSVKMYTRNHQSICGKFQVRDIQKPIISAGDLTDHGSGLWFHRSRSYIVSKKKADGIAHWLEANLDDGDSIDVEKHRGVFEIQVQADSINAVESEEPDIDAEGPLIDASPEEAQAPKTKVTPVYPTKAEIEEHGKTHLPFRSWCRSCVGGRAVEDAHRRKDEKNEKVTVCMDYFYLGTETDSHLASFLALYLRPFKASGAVMVPKKGPTEYAVEAVLHYMKFWGVQACILKGDQEPSIEALMNEIHRRRDDRTMVELSPKGDHQSNPTEGEIKQIEA